MLLSAESQLLYERPPPINPAFDPRCHDGSLFGTDEGGEDAPLSAAMWCTNPDIPADSVSGCGTNSDDDFRRDLLGYVYETFANGVTERHDQNSDGVVDTVDTVNGDCGERASQAVRQGDGEQRNEARAHHQRYTRDCPTEHTGTGTAHRIYAQDRSNMVSAIDGDDSGRTIEGVATAIPPSSDDDVFVGLARHFDPSNIQEVVTDEGSSESLQLHGANETNEQRYKSERLREESSASAALRKISWGTKRVATSATKKAIAVLPDQDGMKRAKEHGQKALSHSGRAMQKAAVQAGRQTQESVGVVIVPGFRRASGKVLSTVSSLSPRLGRRASS